MFVQNENKTVSRDTGYMFYSEPTSSASRLPDQLCSAHSTLTLLKSCPSLLQTSVMSVENSKESLYICNINCTAALSTIGFLQFVYGSVAGTAPVRR